MNDSYNNLAEELSKIAKAEETSAINALSDAEQVEKEIDETYDERIKKTEKAHKIVDDAEKNAKDRIKTGKSEAKKVEKEKIAELEAYVDKCDKEIEALVVKREQARIDGDLDICNSVKKVKADAKTGAKELEEDAQRRAEKLKNEVHDAEEKQIELQRERDKLKNNSETAINRGNILDQIGQLLKSDPNDIVVQSKGEQAATIAKVKRSERIKMLIVAVAAAAVVSAQPLGEFIKSHTNKAPKAPVKIEKKAHMPTQEMRLG